MNPQPLSFRYFTVMIVVLLVTLGGCGLPRTSISEADQSSETITPNPALPIQAPTSPPLDLTVTPLIARTPKQPAPTLGLTLTVDEEQTLVLDLLRKDTGCQLPCWWGFTPGATTWETTKAFFVSLGKAFDNHNSSRGTTNYSVEFRISQHDVGIAQVYIIRDNLIEGVWVKAGTIRDGGRIYGDPLFVQDLQSYMPSQLLLVYGKPAQVLLRTFQSVPEGTFIPFNLLLFYPEQGFLVRYYGPTERVGELIRVCPQQTDITLWLWSPNQQLTLEAIAHWGQQFPIDEVPLYRSLEEATGWSIEQFSQTFVQSGNQACFETPAEMW